MVTNTIPWWLYFSLISFCLRTVFQIGRILSIPVFKCLNTLCCVMKSEVWTIKFVTTDICWPSFDGLSQISEIFSPSSAGRQLYYYGEGNLSGGNERVRPVITTSLQSHLHHIIIISLVTRTPTKLRSDEQFANSLPFTSSQFYLASYVFISR